MCHVIVSLEDRKCVNASPRSALHRRFITRENSRRHAARASFKRRQLSRLDETTELVKNGRRTRRSRACEYVRTTFIDPWDRSIEIGHAPFIDRAAFGTRSRSSMHQWTKNTFRPREPKFRGEITKATRLFRRPFSRIDYQRTNSTRER